MTRTTFTADVTERQAALLRRVLALSEELDDLAVNAPDGAVFDACENAVLTGGRDVQRQLLQNAVARRVDAAEKPGGRLVRVGTRLGRWSALDWEVGATSADRLCANAGLLSRLPTPERGGGRCVRRGNDGGEGGVRARPHAACGKGLGGVCAWVSELLSVEEGQRERRRPVTDRLVRYFSAPVGRWNDAERLASGRAIGSGSVEGQAKTLGLGLKRRGGRWRKANGLRMASLVCVRHASQWDAYWKSLTH